MTPRRIRSTSHLRSGGALGRRTRKKRLGNSLQSEKKEDDSLLGLPSRSSHPQNQIWIKGEKKEEKSS